MRKETETHSTINFKPCTAKKQKWIFTRSRLSFLIFCKSISKARLMYYNDFDPVNFIQYQIIFVILCNLLISKNFLELRWFASSELKIWALYFFAMSKAWGRLHNFLCDSQKVRTLQIQISIFGFRTKCLFLELCC